MWQVGKQEKYCRQIKDYDNEALIEENKSEKCTENFFESVYVPRMFIQRLPTITVKNSVL